MPPTVLGLKISMLGEKVRDLHLDGLAQKGARPIAQDLGEPVGEGSWLNQLDDVIVRHGVSLLRWRSGWLESPPRYAALPLHAVTNFAPWLRQ